MVSYLAAKMYHHGLGFEVDKNRAIELYQAAVDEDDTCSIALSGLVRLISISDTILLMLF